MRRHSPIVAVAVVIVVLVGGCVGFQFLYGSDYKRAPIDVREGAWVVAEPGDEFAVDLLGHPAYPDAAWAVTEMDEVVVELQVTKHNPRAGAPPPPEAYPEFPSYVREVYSTMPEPDRPPDYEDELEGSLWYVPNSGFIFTGRAFGESDIILELWIQGELTATFAFSVTVVEEACQYFEGQESSTQVPHRCG